MLENCNGYKNLHAIKHNIHNMPQSFDIVRLGNQRSLPLNITFMGHKTGPKPHVKVLGDAGYGRVEVRMKIAIFIFIL